MGDGAPSTPGKLGYVALYGWSGIEASSLLDAIDPDSLVI
jgi:hypothetical protein